jgi:trans-aconitate 2-methyltransferase
MSRDMWNPRQYRAYSSHRARPFFELLARVDAEAPAYVVDLGCGPGERTADLAVRWPGAVVEGIDSSEEMISEARRMLLPAAEGDEAASDPGSIGRLAAGGPGGMPSGDARDEGGGHLGDAGRPGAGGGLGVKLIGGAGLGDEGGGHLGGAGGPGTGGGSGTELTGAGGAEHEADSDPGSTGRPGAGASGGKLIDGADDQADGDTDSAGGPGAGGGSGTQLTRDSGGDDEVGGRTGGNGRRTGEEAGGVGIGGTVRRAGAYRVADGAVRGGERRTAARAEASERAVLPAEIVGPSGPSPSGAVVDGSAGGAGGSLSFSVGDLAEWVPGRPVDVIFSNAALQWVPGHQRLLPRWVEALAPGGCLAFSMPGNFDGPSHTLLRELCTSPRWRDRLAQVNRHNVVADPAEYYKILSGLGCDVDAWETTYLQVLHGTDPVLEWMKGTALRPALSALPGEEDREDFLAELAALLRDAYPPGPNGTIFPFRRIFVVAVAP